MKQSIIEKILQVLLIVFSVVLGLFLSERIEDRKSKKEATKLLIKIQSELNGNKELLEYWAPYHQEIVKNLDSLSNNKIFLEQFIKDRSALQKVFTRGTIMSDTPSNDAWDIAKSHPIVVNFDYDQLLIISKIYNQQKSTFESVPKIVDLMLSTDLNSKEKAKSNLKLLKNLLWDVTGRESQLIRYYKEGESILKSQND